MYETIEKSCSLNSFPPEILGLVARLVNLLAKRSFSVLFLCHIANIYSQLAQWSNALRSYSVLLSWFWTPAGLLTNAMLLSFYCIWNMILYNIQLQYRSVFPYLWKVSLTYFINLVFLWRNHKSRVTAWNRKTKRRFTKLWQYNGKLVYFFKTKKVYIESPSIW